MVLSADLVHVLYGAKYQLTETYLPIYASVFFLTGLGYRIIESLFNGVGETKTDAKNLLGESSSLHPTSPQC